MIFQEIRITQSQSLKLTPEMVQSLQVLQMTTAELKTFLDQAMMENPLLEMDEAVLKQPDPDDIQKISCSAYLKKVELHGPASGKPDPDADHKFDSGMFMHSDMNYARILDIQFQLLKPKLTRSQIRIGRVLLDHINDDGYLSADLEELSVSLGVEKDEAEKVLSMIQEFYPAGTGARSVKECLYLQLKEQGPVPEVYRTLLFECLEDIAEHRVKKIERKTGISPAEQMDFLNRLKTLHPRPGSEFCGNEKTCYVVPDGKISWNGNHVSVRLNHLGNPPLIINPVYKKMLNEDHIPCRTREYILDQMRQAAVLLNHIRTRKKTIETIVSVIAEKQKEYLLGKSDTLQPLTRKRIAEETGLSESTVSRTVRGKYFLTPRGTLELKSLFGISRFKGRNAVSPDILKQKIRALIEKEDTAHPLSDQKIADSLSAENVCIARRTVAKYREEMGILTASKRCAAFF